MTVSWDHFDFHAGRDDVDLEVAVEIGDRDPVGDVVRDRLLVAAVVGPERHDLGVAAQRDDDFGRAKVTVGRFYYERLLPRAGALAEQIKAGAGTMMSLDQDLF